MTVEQGRWAHPGPPAAVGRERAVAPCGCAVYVGKRLDNREPMIAATSCSDVHTGTMRDFLVAFEESLNRPEARPAAEVADEMLTMLFAGGTA